MGLLIPEPSRVSHQQHVHNFEQAPEHAKRMDSRREIAGRRKDGTVFQAEATIFRSVLADGQALMTAVLRDISEQRRDRARDARLTMLFEEAVDAILVTEDDKWDGEGRIIDSNEPALEMLGRTREQLLGTKYREIVDAEDWARRPPDKGAFARGNVITVRRIMAKPNGDRIPIQVRLKSMRDGTILLVLRDLSAKEVAEAAIRERDERLRVLFEEGEDPILIISAEESSEVLDCTKQPLHVSDMRQLSCGR